MKLILSIFSICLLFTSTIDSTFAKTFTPPYSSITIHGKTDKKFNRVSLFRSGGSKKPYKTAKVDRNGKYSITISIPANMIESGKYHFTDMRFWNDKNNNKIKDKGEARSQCHFIKWYPSKKKIVMQAYKGPSYTIDSRRFRYDWKK